MQNMKEADRGAQGNRDVVPTNQWLRGVWLSDVYDSKLGRMSFEFEIGEDGWFNVTGYPEDGSEVEYRRHERYQLDSGKLISPAINEGKPVHFHRSGDDATLIIDETLKIPLRRPATQPRARTANIGK